MEDHRAPTAPPPLYLSLCSPLLSHPFPLSFIPPSVPSSPSTLLSSSLFHYLPPSLPPSVSFHVVTHYSADISPSVPPSPRQSLPYWCWPSPLCLGLDGTEGERVEAGGDVPDGQTLNSRGEGRDGGMKGETRKKRRKEERRNQGSVIGKRAERNQTDRLSLPETTDAHKHTHANNTHALPAFLSNRPDSVATCGGHSLGETL